MGWKNTWFGSENPSRGRVVLVLSIFGAMALAVTSMFIRFVPAPMLVRVHVPVLSLLVGLASTAGMFAYASRIGTLSALVGKGFAHLVFVCLLMPAFLGFLFWASFFQTLPWAFTRVFGAPHEERTTMRTSYSHRRKSCDFRLKGGLMESAFSSYIRIDESFRRRHPEQRLEVVLYGRQSAFGSGVQGVRIEK